jgi:hypothetical protein
MTAKPTLGIVARLDGVQERVRQNFDQRLAELQALPAASLVVLSDISLLDNAETVVPHNLGRVPRGAFVSIVKRASTTGLLRNFEAKSPLTGLVVDPAKALLLRTDGFGSTILVDIMLL